MENVFKFSKLKPLIKFEGYKYIGPHNDFGGTNYYIRKIDKYNNYDFMEAKIDGTQGLFKKYMIAAGTNTKILDSFMFSYLKHRKDRNIKKLLEKGFVEKALKENNMDIKELCDFYTNNVPKEIKNSKYFKENIDKGFKVLYVMNNETEKRKFATVYVVLVAEEKSKLADIELNYVRFKSAEFSVSPDFLKGNSKHKYVMTGNHELNITTSILK